MIMISKIQWGDPLDLYEIVPNPFKEAVKTAKEEARNVLEYHEPH